MLHFKGAPIDLYAESGSSRRLWIKFKVFYLGILATIIYCNDVGIYSIDLRYYFSMGTLVWKGTQIHVAY